MNLETSLKIIAKVRIQGLNRGFVYIRVKPKRSFQVFIDVSKLLSMFPSYHRGFQVIIHFSNLTSKVTGPVFLVTPGIKYKLK